VTPTGKARYVIDVIIDAKSTTRRCYEAHSVMKNATDWYLSLIR
jgi:hypothetical protein